MARTGNKFTQPSTRSGKKKYHQGYYKIQNPLKYQGDPTKCIFQSKWELHFMVYCDTCSKILKWGNETVTIPYQDEDGKIHRYYPDFTMSMSKNGDPHTYETYVIEIKPLKEVKPDFVSKDGRIIPPEMYLKTVTAKTLENYEYALRTYMKNLYKWTKAKVWCEKNGMIFKIINEEHLKENHIM